MSSTERALRAVGQAVASSYFMMSGGTPDMKQPEPVTGDLQVASDVIAALRADPVAVLSLLGEDVRADIDCCAHYTIGANDGEYASAADRLLALLAEVETQR